MLAPSEMETIGLAIRESPEQGFRIPQDHTPKDGEPRLKAKLERLIVRDGKPVKIDPERAMLAPRGQRVKKKG